MLLQIGAVLNELIFAQFHHVDDSRLSCHISCNLEVLWLMLCKIIYGKSHYEKVHLLFGCMLILTNEAWYGGCLGSCGSFCFHFTLKDSDSLGIECMDLILKKKFNACTPRAIVLIIMKLLQPILNMKLALNTN